jgi:hypothetical protein
MGICGVSIKEKPIVFGSKDPNILESYKPTAEYKAQNRDYPTYFIGLGKLKVKTILAFDEERMALVEKPVPAGMPIALWSALLQINSDTIFMAGGR